MSEVAPKVAAPKVKKPAKPSEHPPVATMVVAAITNLKEKKGVSLAAIKKYIQTNYKGIDMDRLGSFIRKFLKKAVADGTLATAKGHAGSFKIGEKAKAAPKPKKVKKPKTPTKKAAKPKKVKTPKKKDAAKPKKTKTPKKDAKPKKAKTPKKAAKKPAAAKKTPKKPAAKKPAAKPKAAKKPAAKKPAKK